MLVTVCFGESPFRVLPGASVTIVVNLAAPDATLRDPGFLFRGDVMWEGFDLKPLTALRYGVTADAPKVPGKHNLTWVSNRPGSDYFVWVIVEVTCSDGDMCNGEERYAGGVCRNSSRPLCDDLQPCTDDVCDPATGFCSHTRNAAYSAAECPDCLAEHCVPKCGKSVCGSDGCGGSCGSCATEAVCVAGVCRTDVSNPGTCSDPLLLDSEAAAVNFDGRFSVTGDNSQGIDFVRPSCNVESAAVELLYRITNTKASPVGIEVRMSHISGDVNAKDTVLEIFEVPPELSPEAACLQINSHKEWVKSCSDDSTPPGGLSSRCSYSMKPGYTYFIVADGYSATAVGPFRLNITLSTGCTLNCEGKLCGLAQCLNSTGVDFGCGTCSLGQVCSSLNRCVPSPCVPSCKRGRKCGDDGCGGSCGECRSDQACFVDSGKCRKKETCNHLVPLCQSGVKGQFGCPAEQWCASDCNCYKLDAPLMDLIIDKQAAQDSILVVDNYEITAASCALAEGCATGAGFRRIVKFSTNVVNQGRSDFSPPNPPARFPALYEFGRCHGHWHFEGFALFQLLNASGVVSKGRKQSYCAEDSFRRVNGPTVSCVGRTTCETQGLTRGWVDVYGRDLDCQFLDITDVAAGQYTLRQCTNQHFTFPELTQDNNCVLIPFTVPPVPAK